ncbi:hypothetical protein GCM10018980_45340 [Streptomyces capoamus]|uniref:Uncharacterized protein n=1 Tax=Streptomyces capoamus TaxID=68183 RepID=A0A919EYC5_9ACTN|nr:hypothetical protein [Streptomyces capoamus]GGW20140.1 hypothetical protein GCM10010501_62960 [Streptomyces libani subsp. rufus]GHG58250.1 hypothetical protein GCM10018980_45340 [Streptomyces capoamus]
MDTQTRVPPDPGGARVVLDGHALILPALVRLADAVAVPAVGPGALERVRRARVAADRLAATGRWYGRGTNCPTENPVPAPDGHLCHHGGFFAAPLALALDGLNLALL